MKTGQMSNREGVAIITAILIVALAVSLSMSMLWSSEGAILRVGNYLSRISADTLAKSAVRWSGRYIAALDQNDKDAFGEKEPEEVGMFPVEKGSVTATATASHGKFNLNNLIAINSKTKKVKISKPDKRIFIRLLTQLEIDHPEDLADSVIDWIDPDDSSTSPGGAESSHYGGLVRPYMVANRAMLNFEDIYLVKGFAPDIVEKLRPFVTALPVRTNLNVNSASAMILSAYIKDLKIEDARDIAKSLKENRVGDIGQFRALLTAPVVLAPDVAVKLATKSIFYIISTEANFGKAVAGYNALVRVDENDSSITVEWLQGN